MRLSSRASGRTWRDPPRICWRAPTCRASARGSTRSTVKSSSSLPSTSTAQWRRWRAGRAFAGSVDRRQSTAELKGSIGEGPNHSNHFEPFEPFEPFEFFQNRNFPEFFFRKFKNFRKFEHFLNYRRNSDKSSSKSEQKFSEKNSKITNFCKFLPKNSKKMTKHF